MRFGAMSLLSFSASFASAPSVASQVPEADKLKQQVKELYKAGKYAIIFVLDHSEAVIEDFNALGRHTASDLALVFIASNGVSFCRSFSKRSCL